jgi:hypothetical protein
MRWLVVAIAMFGCSRSKEPGRQPAGSAGSATRPEHVTPASPTITTIGVGDYVSQATAGGSAWALRHVRVRGQLDAVTRDADGCITAVTLHEGAASVQCVLVDPSPIPLHATVTVDAQSSVEGTPSLIHCRVLAPPGPPGPLEPACTAGAAGPGSAAANPLGSAAK